MQQGLNVNQIRILNNKEMLKNNYWYYNKNVSLMAKFLVLPYGILSSRIKEYKIDRKRKEKLLNNH